MASGALSIKLRCASWQQLATIYQRDLSRGTMFLKASNPPAVGTSVRIDLTLPSASVIVLTGVVHQHVTDPQRGSGVELKLAPIPTGSIWLIESALASTSRAVPTPDKAEVKADTLKAGQVPTVTGDLDSSKHAEAEAELIKALTSEAESLKKLNPFLVLGVSYHAGDQDVRNAFGELTKKYHPDRFARYESADLRAVAAEIFILIRDAYRKLGDAAGRTKELASVGKPSRTTTPSAAVSRATPPSGQPALTPAPGAVTPVASGPISVPSGPIGRSTPPSGLSALPGPPNVSKPVRTVGAVHEVGTVRKPPEPALLDEKPTPTPKPAAAIHEAGTVRRPDSGPTTTEKLPPQLGDTSDVEALIDAGKLDEALVQYRHLAKKHPAERVYKAGVELVEGLRALGQRDRLEAAQRFEAALEIDPSNERAARELADMRRQATNERKGLLSRLMGKKE